MNKIEIRHEDGSVEIVYQGHVSELNPKLVLPDNAKVVAPAPISEQIEAIEKQLHDVVESMHGDEEGK